MEFFWIVLYTLLAYLIGGIPSAIWLGKWYYGIDIRDHGTGSASHLNVARIMGIKFSWVVRIIDTAKGILAARLAYPFVYQVSGYGGEDAYIFSLTFGLAALLGHIFPLLAGFRGGKGYHVALGVLLVAHPAITSISLGLTLLIYAFTRIPYLAYLTGILAAPIFILLTRSAWDDMYLPLLLFSSLLMGTLLLTHRDDLRQLLPQRSQQRRRFFR